MELEEVGEGGAGGAEAVLHGVVHEEVNLGELDRISVRSLLAVGQQEL